MAQFESTLVANPVDRFSRDKAHLEAVLLGSTLLLFCLDLLEAKFCGKSTLLEF